MDPPGGAGMGRLARVLLHVGPLDAHPRPVGKVEVPVRVDRLVVLADLIVLGLVGVEVVLPVEGRGPDLAVEGRADGHGHLHRLLVEHRQRAGQAQAHRAHVRVGLVPEHVGTAAEQLGVRLELAVHLEADDHLPPRLHVATPSAGAGAGAGGASSGAAASTAAATFSTVPSDRAGPRSWTPTGSPSSPAPNGMLTAGCPARLDGMVQTSDRYMVSGSPVFAPRAKAVVGAVGPSSTSQWREAAADPPMILVGTRRAWLE